MRVAPSVDVPIDSPNREAKVMKRGKPEACDLVEETAETPGGTTVTTKKRVEVSTPVFLQRMEENRKQPIVEAIDKSMAAHDQAMKT